MICTYYEVVSLEVLVELLKAFHNSQQLLYHSISFGFAEHMTGIRNNCLSTIILLPEDCINSVMSTTKALVKSRKIRMGACDRLCFSF